MDKPTHRDEISFIEGFVLMYYVTALGRHNFDKVVVFVIFWMSTTINVSFTIASFVLTHRQNYGQTIPISLLKMKMKKLFHIQCEYLHKKLYWYVFLLFVVMYERI